jgi:hypothetical protein
MYGGMFLNAGYSFFLIIIIAAYTANLTTILVNDVAQSKVPLVSIDDANSQGARICAMSGFTSLSVIQSSYPKIQSIPAYTNQPSVLLEMVTNGTCMGAVLGQNDWDYAKNSLASNDGCNLVQVGSTIRVINGAW